VNDNQVRGRLEKAKGALNRFAAKVMGNRRLARKGKKQMEHGTVQADVGDMTAQIEKNTDAEAQRPDGTGR
jgi:uncharacterized protein YjbJ (UPF0337 family)